MNIQKYFTQSLRSAILRVLLVVMILVPAISCTKKPPQEEPIVTPPTIKPKLPADIVVVIDNSQSLTHAESRIVLETTLLLADLADVGDRLSVVTFGKTTRIVTSVQIKNNDNRTQFQQTVRQQVNFMELRSDIAAGIRKVKENLAGDALFRNPGESTRSVILLTDGKLEPAAMEPNAAYHQLIDDLRSFSGINLYAVVLGNTGSRSDVPGLRIEGMRINGLKLMENIAQSKNRYFHAESLNQLLTIGIAILNEVKGHTAPSERDRTQFKIDDTVTKMILIVRKRSMDGTALFQSSDLQLIRPVSGNGTIPALHKNNAYRYFDLFLVENPEEGLWQIRLQNGDTPEVLSIIKTPINLRYRAKGFYYRNESTPLAAWLFNDDRSMISEGDYTLQAHLAWDAQLVKSNVFLPLKPDPESGQHLLLAPDQLSNPAKPITEAVTLEIIAQRQKSTGSTALDPWFIRRSPPITIAFKAPFIEWRKPSESFYSGRSFLEKFFSFVQLMQGKDLERTFGAEMDMTHPNNPAFSVPPHLTLLVEHFDEDTAQYIHDADEKGEGVSEENVRDYLFSRAMAKSHSYRYRYRLEGSTESGPFLIESPYFYIGGQSCWECFVSIVLIVFVLYWISDRMAKLGGQVTGDGFDRPQRLRKGKEVVPDKNVNLGNIRFELRAKKYFFIWSKIVMTMKKGNITIGGSPLHPGQSIKLRPRVSHKIVFEGDRTIEVKAVVRII